jgi:universal stress protein E
MAEKNTLLAILELDCAPDTLIDRAAWIARSFSYKVHLVLFEPDGGALVSGFAISSEADRIRQEIRSFQAEMVEDYANKMRADGIEVTTSVLQLRPLGDGILNIADTVKPKLILKATQFHSASERSGLVDTDWQLMRICPYPLWFVKSENMPTNPIIVAAIDPSNAHDKPAVLDHEIVRTAKAVAEAAEGEVHLLHVYERLVGIGAAANREFKSSTLPIDEIDARIKSEHRSAVDALAKACEISSDHAHQLPGRTRDILPTFARSRNAGLVVMGALARWGIKRMIVGSTAERVIDHMACDVLIVRLSEHQLYD